MIKLVLLRHCLLKCQICTKPGKWIITYLLACNHWANWNQNIGWASIMFMWVFFRSENEHRNKNPPAQSLQGHIPVTSFYLYNLLFARVFYRYGCKWNTSDLVLNNNDQFTDLLWKYWALSLGCNMRVSNVSWQNRICLIHWHFGQICRNSERCQ